MPSSLEKLLERDYFRRALGDALWTVIKTLFLMFLGALMYALWRQ